MKIIELIPSLSKRAGAEVFCIDLACELKRLGHEVVVISLYDGIDESFKKRLVQSNVDVYFCKKKKGLDLKCSKILKNAINNFSPDVIHMHLGVLVSYFVAFGIKQKKWELFYTIHNIASKECNKPTKLLRKCYLRKKNLTLIGISDQISNTICKTYNLDSVTTINNGIALKNNIKCNTKSNNLICVARFSEQKNHKMLFNVFNALIREYKEIKLTCIGDGPLLEQYRSQYSNTANIIFTGAVQNVYDYLVNSSIFVLTSSYEGNPISILEAMCVGLPIVAPNVGGIPDVVTGGENGYLFERDNEEQCLRYIIKLLKDETLTKKISNNNIYKAQMFSIEYCALQYEKTFKEQIHK